MAEQVIEVGKPFTVKIPKPKKRNIFNPLNAWRIFSQKGLNTGISSSPQHEGLSILGSENTDPEQLQKDFGCCCLTKGDCILSISVIDEDTTLGYRDPDARDEDYADFRANYPERNLVVFRPQAPPARYCSNIGTDCSVYTAQEWRDVLADPNVFIFGPLVLPEGWGDSGLDYIETVLREDTNAGSTADDWFELLLNMGVIDPNGANSDPNKLVITKTFGKIAIFLDNSGSMRVSSTVPKSWQLFKERLRDEMDITIENGRLIQRPGSREIWIGPHILIEGEDCLAKEQS